MIFQALILCVLTGQESQRRIGLMVNGSRGHWGQPRRLKCSLRDRVYYVMFFGKTF